MIICDEIINEAETNKKSLIGTFNSIAGKNFPLKLHKLVVFVALTNGSGNHNVSLRCVREGETPNDIFRVQGMMRFEGPTETVEISFGIKNVVFQNPGLHAMEFYCDEDLLTERRFFVHQKK